LVVVLRDIEIVMETMKVAAEAAADILIRLEMFLRVRHYQLL
tara:strand:+ start:47 stop:172 length:126 start_codon:yes stop_codon:yes gene_type:complete